ncbi:MAG: DUF885 family protein, partial [Lysobacterales bacterium]
MHRVFFLITTLTLCPAGYVRAGPAEEFAGLLHDSWEWRLKENPVFASQLGDHRYNRQWRDISPSAFERRHHQRQDFHQRLQAINFAQLSPADQLNYELFKRGLEDRLEGYQFKSYLMPLSQRGGVQSLDSMAEQIPLVSVKDYEDWLARMTTLETVIEQTMALLETGRKRGYTAPRILMERLPDQINAQLVDNPEESPFFVAFASMPADIGKLEQAHFRARASEIIASSIVPAYRQFSKYFNESYLPACRDSIAASALPQGKVSNHGF